MTGCLIYQEDPQFTIKMGISGAQSPGRSGTRVPNLPGDWAPGIPKRGDPQFHMTPVRWPLDLVSVPGKGYGRWLNRNHGPLSLGMRIEEETRCKIYGVKRKFPRFT